MNLAVAEAAIREVDDPKTGTVPQYLAGHTLRTAEDGRLAPVRVEDAGDDTYYVHFAVAGEPYFLSVTVVAHSNGVIEAVGAFTTPAIRVHLLIFSETLTPNEITAHVGLTPTHSAISGSEPRVGAWPLDRHEWDFEPVIPAPSSLESMLAALLDHLRPVSARIRSLLASGEADGRIAICSEDYIEGLSGFELSRRHLADIADLSCSLWFDPYASGPDLGD